MGTFGLLLRVLFLRTAVDPIAVPPRTARRLALEAGAIVALAAVLVLGMRGGWQSEPLRWGDAFQSDNEYVNQIALNGLFTLGTTIRAELSDHDAAESWLSRTDTPHARAIARRLIVEPDETLIAPADRTMLRRDREATNWLSLAPRAQRRPNVVLVLMESFSARFVGAVGSPRSFTPSFDALAKQGVLFTRAFSAGTHTHQGVFATLLGFPNLPGYEYLMENQAGNQAFLSLPRLLKDQGYQTLFLYNGNLAWDNMEGFLRKQGIDRFVGGDDFGDTVQQDKVWGVADADLFDRANAGFQRAHERGPFLGVVLTLSNHAPFEVPEPLAFERTRDMGELNRRIDALRYADWSIGRFIERAKQLPYYDDTLFVFVGDHGFHVAPKLTDVHLLYHHVPLLFYGPEVLETTGLVSDRVVSQVNIAPSILGLLGIETAHASWGRNIFSTDPIEGGDVAIFKGSGGNPAVAMVRGGDLLVFNEQGRPSLYRYDLSFPPSVTRCDDPSAEQARLTMQREVEAYIESALIDLTGHRAGPASPDPLAAAHAPPAGHHD